MPRQAGKNQLSAHLEAFLLARRQKFGGSLVKCAPTFRPQVLTSIARLQRLLENELTAGKWRRRDGYVVEVGAASIAFFSAGPEANVVGATASLLLECDEAQDVLPDKWDRDFRPMGATANATSVLYGTPWTDDTLLARQIALNREAEARDGLRRHFQVDWTAVAAANPDYGHHVEAEMARLGEHHPIVRTQYLLRTVAGAVGASSTPPSSRCCAATMPRKTARPHGRPAPTSPGSTSPARTRRTQMTWPSGSTRAATRPC